MTSAVLDEAKAVVGPLKEVMSAAFEELEVCVGVGSELKTREYR